jgi:hypothetical protein
MGKFWSLCYSPTSALGWFISHFFVLVIVEEMV